VLQNVLPGRLCHPLEHEKVGENRQHHQYNEFDEGSAIFCKGVVK
jgi:hypothetical protein